ncbi:MAG: SPFH domain-containing protein, partial [Phycisphaerae bacterium]
IAMAAVSNKQQVDPAQESLQSALRWGFNILRILMILLLIGYALSGWFRPKAGEQGLIARMGRLVRNPDTQSAVLTEDWKLALPDPFDEKILLSGRTETLIIDTFVFARAPGDLGKPLSAITYQKTSLQPGFDGAMITGDQNLTHGLWRVEYRIADGESFVTNVGESLAAVNPILRRITEASIIREMAWRRFEDVTRGDVSSLASSVRDRVRQRADALNLGIEITNVSVETAEPQSVRAAYSFVSTAENLKKQRQESARNDATKILNDAAGGSYGPLLNLIRSYGAKQALGAPEAEIAALRQEIDTALENAGGEVAKRLRTARAEKNEYIERVKIELATFNDWQRRYERFPQVTRRELWNYTMEEVLRTAFEVFYVPDTEEIELLINRDPEIQRQKEIERLSNVPQ